MKNLIKYSVAIFCAAIITSCLKSSEPKTNTFAQGSYLFDIAYWQNEVAMDPTVIAIRLNTLLAEYDRLGAEDSLGYITSVIDPNAPVDPDTGPVDFKKLLFSDAKVRFTDKGSADEKVTITYETSYKNIVCKDIPHTGELIIHTGGTRLDANMMGEWSLEPSARALYPLKIYCACYWLDNQLSMVKVDAWDSYTISSSGYGTWDVVIENFIATRLGVTSAWQASCEITPGDINNVGYTAMTTKQITITNAESYGRTFFVNDLVFNYDVVDHPVTYDDPALILELSCATPYDFFVPADVIQSGAITVECENLFGYTSSFKDNKATMSFTPTDNPCHPKVEISYNGKTKTL